MERITESVIGDAYTASAHRGAVSYVYVGPARGGGLEWERVDGGPGVVSCGTRWVAWCVGRDAVRDAVSFIDATERAAVLTELLRDGPPIAVVQGANHPDWIMCGPVTVTLDGGRWDLVDQPLSIPRADRGVVIRHLAYTSWRGTETRVEAMARVEAVVAGLEAAQAGCGS